MRIEKKLKRRVVSVVWLMMFVLSAFYGLTGSAWAQTDVDVPWELKLDAEARLLLSSFDDPESEQFVSLYDFISFYYDEDGEQWLVNVFILLDDPENALLLGEIGVECRTQVRDIVVARLPIESLPLLAQQPYVLFVETSTIQTLHMDASRPEIQADQVHQGIGLPQTYEGEGVVVGVIDSGIDFTHPDFSDSGGTRIQYLLEYTQGGGQNEWTKSQIDANPGSVTQRDADGRGGHGTHVTGTAAGGGKGNPIYRGIAPKADIIFVKAILSTTKIIKACEYIFQKAQALGKPAVVNMSFGLHFGPHDGSSLYEQSLSHLTGPGRIIVASAGNEGWTDPNLAVHAGGTVVPYRPYGSMLRALRGPTQAQVAQVDIWYDQGVISDVKVVAYKETQNQFVMQASTGWLPAVGWVFPSLLCDSNGVVLGDVYVDTKTVNDPRNGDGEVLLQITNNGDPAVDIGQTAWVVAFRTVASGEVHMWPVIEPDAFRHDINFSDLGYTGLPVDSNYTIAPPATAKKVISVGSYVTKNSWIDVDGTARQWPGRLSEYPTIGPLSIFSSKGPTRDKRIAPDVAAPGELIASALSSHLTEGLGYERPGVVQGGGYQLMQGTSMSAPHVTGIVALMLEVNPNLDYNQVVNILKSTARSDGFTGTGLPDNMFGAGKADALAAIQATNAPGPQQVIPVDPGTNGLIAYYAMENSVSDSSGNRLHGTIRGNPNFVAGHNGGMALDLDGYGDYVDCGYDPLFDVTTNEITVSAWVTIRSIAHEWAAIAAKGEYAWRLGNVSWDPRFHFGICIWNAPDASSIDGVTAVGYDEWHHVAGMFDGSNIMVYLDGALDASVPTTEPISVNTANMLIGDNPEEPDRYWDGLIDELKIYDRALSAGELMYLAGSQPAARATPIHSYTFEDGTTNDSIGSADGTLVGGATVVGGALVTSAQNQWMEMPGNVIAMNTFNEVTIEAWYTPTAGTNTGYTMLAYFGDSVNGLGSNGFFMTSARGDNKSRAAISIGNTSAPYNAESGADGPEYDDGLLHHMVSTLNATDITLYIDGVLIDSTSLDPHNRISGISQNFAYLAKGGYDPDPEWIGSIEEFNIYNVALSAQDVAANYAAGPVLAPGPAPGPVAIAVVNFSFELPGTGKQNCWDGGTNSKGTFQDVPGWSSDTMAADSGVETGFGATDGIWTGFIMGADPSVWQLTSHIIGAADVIELKVDAANNWHATTLQMSLYYEDGGARVRAASAGAALTGTMQEFTLVLTAADVSEAIGKRLGIELANSSPDGQSWVGIDNVRLNLIN